MNYLVDLFKMDISSIFIGCFLFLSAVVFVIEIIGKISVMIGKPMLWIRKKNEDHELLISTISALNELRDKHNNDINESTKNDNIIKNDLGKVSDKIDNLSNQISQMQQKIDETEMAKLKDTLVTYYKRYKDIGEWRQFESDAFWGLYDRYISHGGNSFVKSVIKPVMEELKIID